MSSKTALILIDVYNDFLHPKGKLTAGLAESLKDSNTTNNLTQVLQNARSKGMPIYYSLHQQYHDGKYAGSQHWNAMLQSIEKNRAFEEGSFGAEIFADLLPQEGETIIAKHWNQRYAGIDAHQHDSNLEQFFQKHRP